MTRRRKVLIAGSGYLGQAILSMLSEPFTGIALTRSREKAQSFTQKSIPLVADLLEPDSLRKIPGGVTDIIYCAAPDKRSSRAYRDIYLKGPENLINADPSFCGGVRFVYVSSTAVWGCSAGESVSDATPRCPRTEREEIVCEAETAFLKHKSDGIVLRLSGLFGPGRNRIERMVSGDWPGGAPDNRYLNLVHVRDAARAALFLLDNGCGGEVYLATSPLVPTSSELYEGLRGVLGLGPLEFAHPDSPLGKKCTENKLSSLGFQYLFPDPVKAYAEIASERV